MTIIDTIPKTAYILEEPFTIYVYYGYFVKKIKDYTCCYINEYIHLIDNTIYTDLTFDTKYQWLICSKIIGNHRLN